MAISRKALVVCMAVLVVWVPVFAQPILLGVFPTKQAAEQALGTSSTSSQSSVVLPQGEELGDEELSQTDGEFFWFLAFGVFYGGILAIYHNWFDGTYGIDHNDLIDIVGTSFAAAIGGEVGGAAVAAYQAFK